MFKNILAAAAFGAFAMGAQAATNLLTNGDFESAAANVPGGWSYCYDVAVPSGNPTCGAMTAVVAGWTGVVYIQSGSSAWQTPNSQANSAGLGSMIAGVQGASSLTSDYVFTAGQTYLLIWEDAGRAYGGSQQYTVSAGGVTDTQTFTTSPNGWTQHSFEFVADDSSALVFQGQIAADNTSFFDNVSVTAVPEPTSLLMMAFGTLGLLAWRRRAQV